MANSRDIIIRFFVAVACILSVASGYRGSDCSCHDVTESGMTDVCSLVTRAIKTADRIEGKLNLYFKNKYDDETSPFISNHKRPKMQNKIQDEMRDIDDETWIKEMDPMVEDLKVQERLNIYRRLYDLEIKSYRKNKALKDLQAALENYTEVDNRVSLHEKLSGVVSDTLQAMDSQVSPNTEKFSTASDVDVESTTPYQPPVPDDGDLPLSPHTYTPDLCKNATIDAVTKTQDGNTYFFQGDFYWKYLSSSERLAQGYPRKIADDWYGLEGNLDTAFRLSNDKTYFLKGGRCWRFTNQNMDTGYPKPLEAEFRGIPPGVNAAFLWTRAAKAYFFKGDQYWVYDINKDPPVDDESPRLIWDHRLINMDAIIQWDNGRIYFFKDGYYFRFYYNSLDVDNDPVYPADTHSNWFRC